MLINLDQCQILLAEDMIDNIQKLFKQYNCSDISLYAPQYGDEAGKINFYIKDHDDMDPYTASCLIYELKTIIQREDITLSVDSLIEPEFKSIIQRNTIPFERSNLEKLYDSLKGFNIEKEENEDGATYVIIKFSPSVPGNTINELIKNYSSTTEGKIHDALEASKIQPKAYSSKIF